MSVRPKHPSDSSIDEGEFVSRVVAGDRAAFRPLVERFEPAVFALATRLLDGDRVEAEDLAQETFLRAFRRLGELKDRRRFGPWVYQIARSLCRDRRRKLALERRVLFERSEIERWAGMGDRVSDPAFASSEIDEVMISMPSDERRALELKYFEGLSYREIAERLDLSFARVDHLIRSARGRLQRRVSVTRRESVTRLHGERHL